MADSIRYYFDEHLPPAVAIGLRARGIDILTTEGAGRLGRPDDDQLRFATSEGRVMATHDADYLILAASFLTTGEPFAGVAHCAARKYQADVGRLIRALVGLHARLSAADMLNHVEYL